MIRIAVLALLLVTAVSARAFDPGAYLAPRSDRYAVEWGGITLGEGTIALSPDVDGCWRYSSSTDPIALVRWTYGAPREISRFCLRDGEIESRHFQYVNDKREAESFMLDFDWRRNEVKTLKGGVMTVRELPGRAYDRFVIREAVRLWVIRHAAGEAPAQAEFTMVDDDRMKTYRFAVVGREIVKTPAGSFDAIRIDRIDDPRRPFHYWLAPSRDYVPVKLEHLKKGKVELRMTLLP
ncbi:Protein of unknown function [Fontimonas thermophila]|uniref:DUF3108 domain-containing protein n=1 Tax=Fontimonas thermophila TaxID=1076937 RepID=A0A1I2IMC3_9GAMM|nr:DUF3108 domain-containing protein [Fontimonas thermophila]SFF43404.1 Protein of unknown function [Fontimonas thermophila]